MTLKNLVAATLAALPVFAAHSDLAAARAPAPLLPTALVEDVTSATAGVAFMDYVGRGQQIMLAPGDTLVLSYLKSCEHETITGGTVTVGFDKSDVRDGRVVRTKVPCDGGTIELSSAQANASAASAFRVQSADVVASPTLFARTPLVQLPNDLAAADRTLTLRRTDRPGERRTLMIDDATAAAGFYDLARQNVSLARGATYEAAIGARKLTFHIDAKAKSGATAVVSRLLRFP